MSNRILIRGEVSWWLHFFRVVAALATIVGICLATAGLFAGWIVAPVAGVISLILEAVAWSARRTRTWLTFGQDSLEIEDRTGRRTVLDTQVVAAALESKRNLNNGEFSSTTRTFRIWTDDRTEPIVMQNTIPKDRPDPLAELIARLLDGLTQRFEDLLARGGTVAGDGWVLTRGGLALSRVPSETLLPLAEITAVDPFDDKMCVWRRGQDEACAKLPLSGRNAYLLPALLKPLIPEQADGSGGQSSTGLGRVLFERRPQPALAVLLIAIGGIMALVGVIIIAAGGLRDAAPLALLVPGGLILAAAGAALRLTNFRCHERGVWQKSIFGQKLLRYVDIGSFTYSAQRHYHNGAYAGTHLSLVFKPLLPKAGAPQAGRPIRFSTTVQGDDDDLDELRDVISHAICARMAGELAAGQTVPWTPNLEFTPHGIRYRPSSLFGRKDFEFLPFECYGGQSLNQGSFFLFSSLRPKHVMSEQCSVENFFPGFYLLLQLCHGPPADSAQPAATTMPPEIAQARAALSYGSDPAASAAPARQPGR